MLNDLIVYPEGFDLVWVGIDNSGYVGAFITAGIGAIPKFALQNNIFLLENIEQLILELHENSEALLHVDLPRPDDYLALAKRGLYVYDWSDIHEGFSNKRNAYELMATPSVPLHVSSFDDSVFKNYLENIRLDLVEFKLSNIVDVKDKLECLEG